MTSDYSSSRRQQQQGPSRPRSWTLPYYRRCLSIFCSRRERILLGGIMMVVLIISGGGLFWYYPSNIPKTVGSTTATWSWSLTMDAPPVTTTTTTKSFRGKQYWKPGVTQAVRTILETPFARFQVHSIQLGDDNRKIINDWLWFDEADHVNVLVQESKSETEEEEDEDEEDTFIVLEQTKYAIEGSTYAVVGGMIEMDRDHNDPLAAAKREVLEELNMEAATWKKLGTFVVSANRGGGTTHVYWAQDAQPRRRMDSQKSSNFHTQKIGGGGGEGSIADGELERQRVVRLSRKELLDALLDGKFKEIKWTATVALALLDHARENTNVV